MEAWINQYGDLAIIALVLVPLWLIVRLLGQSIESPESPQAALGTRRGLLRAAAISACFAVSWGVIFTMTWQDANRAPLALGACGFLVGAYLLQAFRNLWKARKLAI